MPENSVMTGLLDLEIAAAHPLVILGVVLVFLLLFLLYRERRQPHHQNVTYNYAPSITNQYIEKQTPEKSAATVEPSVSDQSGKSEWSTKAAEQRILDDDTAGNRVSHRNVPSSDRGEEEPIHQVSKEPQGTFRHSDEEVDKRTFSQPVLTGSTEAEPVTGTKTFSTAPPDSDKSSETNHKELDRLEMGNTKSMRTESTGRNTKKRRKQNLPELESHSSTEPFTFKVDDKGCHVVTRYCKLTIPAKSIVEPDTITMAPHYIKQSESVDEIIITPYVTFKSLSGNEPIFTKDVTMSLYSEYSAANDKEKIPVKVLWSKGSSSPLSRVAEAYLGHGKFISFTCRHFCRYCCAAERCHFHSMKRRYCYAGYVRRSAAPTRIFHWMLIQDCPSMYDRLVKYLKDEDKVMDPESFDVDYNYTLQMIVKRGGPIDTVEQDRENVALSQLWGSSVEVTHQFEMMKTCDRSNANFKVKYSMFALHNDMNVNRMVRDKHFYYEWKDGQPNPRNSGLPDTVNVYGGGVGVLLNSYQNEQQPVQPQESMESDATGVSPCYGSPPTAPSRVFDTNERNEAMLPAVRQDSGFNEQEEQMATTPKLHDDAEEPQHHSTQRVSPVVESSVSTDVIAEDRFHSSTPVEVENDTRMESKVEDSSPLSFAPLSTSTFETFHQSLENSLIPQETECHADGSAKDETVARFSSAGDSGVDTFNESAFLSEDSASIASLDIEAAVASTNQMPNVREDRVLDTPPTSDSPPKSLETGAVTEQSTRAEELLLDEEKEESQTEPSLELQ